MEIISDTFKIISLLLIYLQNVHSISDYRLCGNEDCSEILSYAKTLIRYPSTENYVLSFKKNDVAIVYSKSAGSKQDLWGVEIDGKRGYVPHQFLKEGKILKKPGIKVPTEIYEVVDDELVLKKIKKPQDGADVVEREKIETQSEKRTEKLPTFDRLDKPPIKSGVLKELPKPLGKNIKASQPYAVLEGTTVFPDVVEPPAVYEESNSEETDEEQIEDLDDEYGESAEDENNSGDELSASNEEDETSSGSDSVSSESEILADITTKSEAPIINTESDTSENILPMDSEVNKDESNSVATDLVQNLNESNESADNLVEPAAMPNDLNQSSTNNEDKLQSTFTHIESGTSDSSADNLTSNEENSKTLLKNDTIRDNSIEPPKPQIINDLTTTSETKNLDNNFLGSDINDNKQSVEILNDTINVGPDKSVPEHSLKPKSGPPLLPQHDQFSRGSNPNLLNDGHQKKSNLGNFHKTPNKMPEGKNAALHAKGFPNRVPITDKLLSEKKEVNIENIYRKPQLSISSRPPDHPQISLENEIQSENNTIEIDIVNGTDISESESELNPDIILSTKSPENSITEFFTQEEIPILIDDYSETSTQSTQSTQPSEPPPQYPDIASPNLLATENLNKPEELLDDMQNLIGNYKETLKNEELVDSSQDFKENTSEYKDDFLQSETQILDEVNKNILINNHDSIESASVDGQTISKTYISNIFNIFEGLSGKIFDLFKLSGDAIIPLENILREDKSEDINEKLSLPNEEPGFSRDSVASIFTDPSPSQCLPEEGVESWRDVSPDKVFWLVISAVTILIFTLGYYYLENSNQDGKLLSMVNSLQKELLCTSKECIILKEELTVTKEKLIGIEDSSFGADEMVACLKKEVAECQQTISELHDKLGSAEEELANSTEAALELQAILDDQLSSKDNSSSSLAFTVANLQSQLDDQQTNMSQAKAQLAAKVEENEMLIMKIVETNNKCVSMEKELADLQNQLRQARDECESKSGQLQDLTSNMEKSLLQAKAQKAIEVKELKSQLKSKKEDLDSAKATLKARTQEVTSLQESLRLLKLDSKNIEAILDMSHSKAELTQALSEKVILAEKLENEKSLLLELSNKSEEQDAQMAQMKEQLKEAEQKAIQATSRLDVLTNYFNQKEAELLKELSSKENLWLSQQGEAMSTVEKIQSLQQEIQQYKETAEGIRRELAEQEVAWRAQGAALERRAHEQWLARRAAERAAEASAAEAQALRHRLAAPSPTDKRVVSPLTLNAGDGMLPPPLGFLPPPLPPLPPPFLPPPPPHRPPPLGRLSSPPPLPHMRHHRYSPDSRYSPDRDYSPDRRSTPQHRGRSPFSPQEAHRRGYPSRRYDDDRYYDSGEDRRSRRYDETETDLSPPPSPPPRRLPLGPRNHKGASSGSGQSSESLERISKHSGKY